MNNGKRQIVFLTLNEIELIKSIIPDVEYKILSKFRNPYSNYYYYKNRKKINEYQKEYRKRKKREKEKEKKNARVNKKNIQKKRKVQI